MFGFAPGRFVTSTGTPIVPANVVVALPVTVSALVAPPVFAIPFTVPVVSLPSERTDWLKPARSTAPALNVPVPNTSAVVAGSALFVPSRTTPAVALLTVVAPAQVLALFRTMIPEPAPAVLDEKIMSLLPLTTPLIVTVFCAVAPIVVTNGPATLLLLRTTLLPIVGVRLMAAPVVERTAPLLCVRIVPPPPKLPPLKFTRTPLAMTRSPAQLLAPVALRLIDPVPCPSTSAPAATVVVPPML